MRKEFIPKITEEEFKILNPKCGCPCNQSIPWNERYKYYDIPIYLPHHNVYMREIIITKEEFDRTGPYYCGCPDKEIIEWNNRYRWCGIPKYKRGHQGKGKHLSKETKDKIGHSNSIVLKGRPSPNKGKKLNLSDEQRKVMSERRKGCVSWWKGKRLSVEHRNKLSISHMGKPSPKKGKPIPEELKERLKYTEWNHTGQCGENSPAWKGGTSFGKYCPKFNEQKKEEIREIYNRKCFLCNKPEEENSRKLCIHHIDSDKEQGCNGKKWELVPLCDSCHSKTIYNNIFWMEYIRSLLKYIEFYRIRSVWIWFIG